MNTLGKIVLFDFFLYFLTAIFMGPLINQYLAGQSQLSEISQTYGVQVNGTSVSFDQNNILNPVNVNPNVNGILNSALNFLAPVLSVLGPLKSIVYTALSPVIMLGLPDTIIPSAFKLFILIPMDLLAVIGVIGFIRGYFV